jgi:DNA-binding IclR family transcriptional regulator
MERIHERVGETVFLLVRRGRNAVCIERLEGLRVQSLALRLGGSLPLHVGAGPRVLLAWEPESEWESYAADGTLEALAGETPMTRDALLAELARTRERGYAVSDEDVTPGIASLGAPILDYTGGIRAALSIGGMKSLVLGAEREEFIRLLVDGARDISRTLGHEAA